MQEAINRFKNERFPSVVVTVDLLTTGIDVPEITTLVFLRRVKSRILFEQMMGRATRLCPEIHKTHFEIYDPVGVYDSLAPVNTMKPVVVNPETTFEQLLDGLEVLEDENQVKNQIDQNPCKSYREKKRHMDDRMMEHFVKHDRREKDPRQVHCGYTAVSTRGCEETAACLYRIISDVGKVEIQRATPGGYL